MLAMRATTMLIVTGNYDTKVVNSNSSKNNINDNLNGCDSTKAVRGRER